MPLMMMALTISTHGGLGFGGRLSFCAVEDLFSMTHRRKDAAPSLRYGVQYFIPILWPRFGRASSTAKIIEAMLFGKIDSWCALLILERETIYSGSVTRTA
jgi:hypothetical protein